MFFYCFSLQRVLQIKGTFSSPKGSGEPDAEFVGVLFAERRRRPSPRAFGGATAPHSETLRLQYRVQVARFEALQDLHRTGGPPNRHFLHARFVPQTEVYGRLTRTCIAD